MFENSTIHSTCRSDALDDKKWMDEYKDKDASHSASELAKTANELLAGVDDPKLNQSEVHCFSPSRTLLNFQHRSEVNGC